MADHKIEAAWIPFKDTALPAWFHLPPNYKGGTIPVIINVPGMDSYKEIQTALYGDRFLNRGFAVLTSTDPANTKRRCSASISAWTIGGDWQSRLRLARQAAGSGHEQGRAVGHELRHFLRHAGDRARAADLGLRRHLGVP